MLQFFHSSPSNFFCARANWGIPFSGVGKSSGMVPPRSSMVARTLVPTSKWVGLAFIRNLIAFQLFFRLRGAEQVSSQLGTAHMVEYFLALF